MPAPRGKHQERNLLRAPGGYLRNRERGDRSGGYGVLPDGVDLSLEDNVLTIQGRREEEKHGGRMVLEEYEPGHYLRRFTVAKTIDQEHIEASLADGVLRVRLPKAAPAQPKKIAVKIG